jgi:hypothetical protein
MDDITTLGIRRKRKILKAHRGILSQVARKHGVARQTVTDVFWGRKTSAPILTILKAELEKCGAFNEPSVQEASR